MRSTRVSLTKAIDVEAKLKPKTKTGSRALYQLKLMDVKSASRDLQFSVDCEFTVQKITALQLTH